MKPAARNWRDLKGPARTAAIRARRSYRKDEFADEFKAFSQYVRQLRRRTRATQAEFASLVGVSRSAVIRWERKVCFPDLPQRKRLAELQKELDRTQSPEDIARLSEPDDE